MKYQNAALIIVFISLSMTIFANDYRVGHIPMLEKNPTLVLSNSDSNVLDELSLSVDAGKPRESLTFTANSDNWANIAENAEGARFVIIETLKSANPETKTLAINKVFGINSGSIIQNIFKINELDTNSAGYKVVWNWKDNSKKNRMWVLIYAPGKHSLKNAIRTACDVIGWNDSKPINSANQWGITSWTIITDPKLAKLGAIDVWLNAQFDSESYDYLSINLNDYPSSARAKLTNKAFLINQDTWKYLPQNMMSNIGNQLSSISKSSENEPSCVSSEAYGLKTVVMTAYNTGLWKRLFNDFPNLDELITPNEITITVPDLRKVKRLGLIITSNQGTVLPANALKDIYTEIVKTTPFTRVTDISDKYRNYLTPGESVINLSSLNTDALSSFGGNIDAVLCVNINETTYEANWQFEEPKLPKLPTIPDEMVDEPYTDLSKSKRESEDAYSQRISSWISRHHDWLTDVVMFNAQYANQKYLISRKAEWADTAEVNLSMALFNAMPNTNNYGELLEDTVINDMSGAGDSVLREYPQNGFVSPTLQYKSGYKLPANWGEYRYLGIRLGITYSNPTFDPLPVVGQEPNSKAWGLAAVSAISQAIEKLYQQVLLK